MRGDVWVFGYGSLVAPESVERTIGRPVGHTSDRVAAHLAGSRRLNPAAASASIATAGTSVMTVSTPIRPSATI